MPDTFTSILRVRLQQTGANTNTWGNLLNTAALQLLEDAIAGKVNITLAGSDVTLTTANGANDQARYAVLNLVGAPGAARNVIVPNLSKPYFVIDSTTGGFQHIIKTAGGSGVTIPAGGRKIVYCDGTDVVNIQADNSGTPPLATNALQLGGIPAASYARLDVSQNWTRGQAVNFSNPADGPTITIDCTLSNSFRTVLGGNRIIALNNPKDGQEIDVWLVQDGTGGRTVTWPVTVVWEGGTTPVLSTAPAAIDRFRLKYNLATNLWSGEAILNSASIGSSTINLIIDRNEMDVDVYARAGSPANPVTVNVTVETGVVVHASCTKTAALNLNGFAATSVINLTNLGYIIGKGGRGGMGGGNSDVSDGETQEHLADSGEDGGNAINGPGAGITFNITNGNGRIWGGGGGGGGGGYSYNIGASNTSGTGGGGGGAGGGAGGEGMRIRNFASAASGFKGAAGSTGRNGAGGAGGAGASTGSAIGGSGGAGGDYGAAGSAGDSPTTYTYDRAGGAGGAAGKAIELNGGSPPTFISGSGSPNVKGAIS
jgi:hypothetical protein